MKVGILNIDTYIYRYIYIDVLSGERAASPNGCLLFLNEIYTIYYICEMQVSCQTQTKLSIELSARFIIIQAKIQTLKYEPIRYIVKSSVKLEATQTALADPNPRLYLMLVRTHTNSDL